MFIIFKEEIGSMDLKILSLGSAFKPYKYHFPQRKKYTRDQPDSNDTNKDLKDSGLKGPLKSLQELKAFQFDIKKTFSMQF